MIDWLTYSVVFIALAAGMLAIVLGLLGRIPSDVTVGLAALVAVLLLVLGAVAIVFAATGRGTTGSAVEWVGYLVTAVIVVVLAVFWSLVQRTRWGTVILGAALLTVSIMVVRMEQVWFPIHL